MTSWEGHARAVLDDAGLRTGQARNAVIALLADERCALSAFEIEERLRAGTRSVARASVYRVLDQLVEHGLVQRVELGEESSRYEKVEPGGEHHHHLLCARCGRLIPFSDDQLERSIERAAHRLGANIADHEVVLRGACERCAAS
jgi:Fur family ferric uptake transcriptional regulator